MLDDPVCDIAPSQQLAAHPTALEAPLFYKATRLAVIHHGTVPWDENTRVSVALGQPSAMDLDGRVMVRRLLRANGTPAAAAYALAPPTSFDSHRFGTAVAAADVRACHVVGSGSRGCGRELLVGAPGEISPEGAVGAVHWYQAQSVSTNAPELEWAGVIPAPAGVSSSFGIAIAAPSRVADASAPWDPAPAAPPWIAVSAVNPSAVYIYTVNPSSGSPFTLAMVIPAPTIAGVAHFGRVMAVGDFDGDGLSDLAVSHLIGSWVDFSERGFVNVFWGQSGPEPFDVTDRTELEIVGWAGNGAEFGSSLAAGPIFLPDPRDGLVIGAPGTVAGEGFVDDEFGNGAVCVARFNAATRATEDMFCRFNPLGIPVSTLLDRFGESVAVGDVYPVDQALQFDTDAARRPEVIVGAPGHDGTGVVAVFKSDLTGPDYTTLRARIDPMTHETAYGGQVGSGYVQRSPWKDIVAYCEGCDPNRRAEVTRALPPIDVSGCPSPSGVWEVTDHDGVPRRVSIAAATTGSTRITFDEPFAIALRETVGLGPVCTVGPEDDILVQAVLPAGTIVSIPSVGTCDAGVRVFDDVPAGPLVIPVLASLGVWASLPSEIQDILLNEEIGLSIDVVPPSGGTPPSISLTFDVTPLPLGWAAAIYPNYNLAGPGCNVPSFAGVNIEGTFSVGVCE